MRDSVTTALETAGFLSAAVAVGLVTYAWLGFAIAAVALFAVGVVEGRRR